MGNGHQVQIARKRHFTVSTFNSVAGHGARQLDKRFPLDLYALSLSALSSAFLINRLLFLWLH